MNNSIDLTSLLLQIYNLILLMQDFNNSDLMKELQKQDKNYLEKIINQNNKILEILKEKGGQSMQERVVDETKKHINRILEEGIEQGNNLEYLDKLIDIQKDAYKIMCMKEDKEMYGEYGNYGNYSGRGAGYDSYGRYGEYGRGSYGRDSYGRRGVDSRYRGHEHLDRMYGEYGRYQESRERYGANSEETKKSLKYMLESMEDFARMLREDAQNQEEVEMIRQTAQRIAQM